MPERSIHKIMAATEPADVAQMAVIECLRQIADGNKKTGQVLEGMQAELRDVRERVIRIEASEFKAEVAAAKAEIEKTKDTTAAEIAALETRVDRLEAHEDRRGGAQGFADALLKYGPFAIAVITALFIVLVATERIVL